MNFAALGKLISSVSLSIGILILCAYLVHSLLQIVRDYLSNQMKGLTGLVNHMNTFTTQALNDHSKSAKEHEKLIILADKILERSDKHSIIADIRHQQIMSEHQKEMLKHDEQIRILAKLNGK